MLSFSKLRILIGAFASLFVVTAMAAGFGLKSSQGNELIEASNNGNIEAVKVLLAKGADANAKDAEGRTALMHAAPGGWTFVVQELIAAGADVNARDKTGQTVLMWASPGRDVPEIVKALITKGVDVNAKDRMGVTALMIASSQDNPGIVRELLANGADVNARNNVGATALMAAASRGNTEVVKELLAKNADVNAKDKNGKTALDLVPKTASETKQVLALAELENVFIRQPLPYIGKWSNGRGDTLAITATTIQFANDKPVKYRDVTKATDGREFHLEITSEGKLNYLTKFLGISMGEKPDEMKMKLYDTRKDLEDGENSQGEATWYRDK